MSQKQWDAVPLKLFAGVGAIEAISGVLGFIGASKLPGVKFTMRIICLQLCACIPLDIEFQ